MASARPAKTRCALPPSPAIMAMWPARTAVGAVMGNKQVKAVCIVRGSKALRAADVRGLYQAADEIAHDLKTDPSTRSLYEYGTLPGVVNLLGLGALPIKNYTTNVKPEGVDMSLWEAPRPCAMASIIAAISAVPAACITAIRRCCPPGRIRGRSSTSRNTKAGPALAGPLADRPGGGLLAEHADRPGLCGCQ